MAGMSFVMTGLVEQDYQPLQRWLQQGAALDEQALQASPAEARQVAASMPAAQVPGFAAAMEQAGDAAAFEQIVERRGIRRTHPQFRRYFHDLAAHIREHQPLVAGVLDMNRYQDLQAIGLVHRCAPARSAA